MDYAVYAELFMNYCYYKKQALLTHVLLMSFVLVFCNNVSNDGMRANILTWHVHHAAVTVLYQVACLTVDAACCDAVGGKEVGVDGFGPAVTPWRGQVGQLERHTKRKEGKMDRKKEFIHIHKKKTITELLKPFCVTHLQGPSTFKDLPLT